MYGTNAYPNYYQQSMRQPIAPPPVPMPNAIGLKGRPVSSLEEVRAISIDFDGSVSFFPDLANKRIYTKQIGMDGTAILNMYELCEVPIQQTVAQGDFITRKEFEEALNGFKAMLIQQQQQQQPADTGIVNF